MAVEAMGVEAWAAEAEGARRTAAGAAATAAVEAAVSAVWRLRWRMRGLWRRLLHMGWAGPGLLTLDLG